MNRRTIVLTALPLVLVADALFFGFRIHAELASGMPVFWLAELWAPAAVAAIMLVVSIDLLVAPAPQAKAAAQGRPARRRAPKAS